MLNCRSSSSTSASADKAPHSQQEEAANSLEPAPHQTRLAVGYAMRLGHKLEVIGHYVYNLWLQLFLKCFYGQP